VNNKRLVPSIALVLSTLKMSAHILSALIAALTVCAWTIAGCAPAKTAPTVPGTTGTNTSAETPAPSTGLANPASVHCEAKGHTLEIRSDKDGNQYGVCVFADGTECNEWAFFRGECSPGTPPAATTTPAPPAATPVPSTATPAPSLEPGAECAPITVESGPEFKLWRKHVHETYGFTLLVPPGWAIEEITEPPHHTLRGHALILWSAEEPRARFQVAFRHQDEEQFIGRTGVGAGEIVDAGTVCFCGQEMGKRKLVFEGKDMTVLYGPGPEIERGDLAFTLYLDYRGGWEDKTALSKEIQAQVDQIIATFQLPDGS
jgi:putative hemolysin